MVAVRLPQPRHCAPHTQIKFLAPEKRGTTLFAPCGAWGCLIAVSIRTFPRIGFQQHLVLPIEKK